MSWIDDEVDEPSTSTEGADKSDSVESGSVEKQIQAILAAGNADISMSLLEQSLPDIQDTDLLERLHDAVDSEIKREAVSERLSDFEGYDTQDSEESNSEQSEPSESKSDGDDEPDSGIDSFDEFDSVIRQGILDGDISHISVEAITEYGPELDTDVLERASEEATRTPATTRYESFLADKKLEENDGNTESVFGGSDDEESQSATEDSQADSSSNESEHTHTEEETESEPTEADSGQSVAEADGGSDEAWKDAFNRASQSTSGINVTEAAEMENRWSILVWSDPGKGKTHFGYSAKDPVCIIDTEGKSHHLADKFDDKMVEIYQPSDYDEALDALHDAVDLLENVKRETGRIGTVVVDSMSIMWEWSQQKYVDKFYRGKDKDEVNFSSAIGSSGQSDWKQIKRYHNTMFRQTIIDSPFHFVWTAMATDDYEAAIENDINFTPKKPSGEKDNEYKASEVLRLREDSEGKTIAELEKSDKVNHNYTGLEKPDFPKHQNVVRAIKDAESDNRSMSSVEAEFGVEVFEGNPRTARITKNKND
jgi:hypothetical protein